MKQIRYPLIFTLCLPFRARLGLDRVSFAREADAYMIGAVFVVGPRPRGEWVSVCGGGLVARMAGS